MLTSNSRQKQVKGLIKTHTKHMESNITPIFFDQNIFSKAANQCGRKGLDRDKDGVPCEEICN